VPARAKAAARRGEIWLVDFGEPVGHEQGYQRPAVVVSANRMNASRAGLVIVVPTTTSRRDLPSHVEIDGDDAGLRETSYAKVEDLKSVSVDRLVHRLGRASAEQVAGIERVLLLLLAL
jgi:mRNA interferase MazF